MVRNLLQYPATRAEKLALLDRCEVLLSKEIGGAIGGHQLHTLRLIRDDIMALPADEE